MKRAPAPKEIGRDGTHAAVKRFLDVALPKHSHHFHVPNGGDRSGASHGLAKVQGERAGEVDHIVLYYGRAFGIEMKRQGRKASSKQDDVHAEWVDAGCPVAVCYDVDDVVRFLTVCGIPLRANVSV